MLSYRSDYDCNPYELLITVSFIKVDFLNNKILEKFVVYFKTLEDYKEFSENNLFFKNYNAMEMWFPLLGNWNSINEKDCLKEIYSSLKTNYESFILGELYE